MPKNHEKEAEIISMAGQKGAVDDFHQHGWAWNGYCAWRGGYRIGRVCISWVPNAMKAGVLTTSCADDPVVRGDPGSSRFLPGPRGRPAPNIRW